ncbi:MAG: hypothetical protein V1824_04800 [archaeon]
MNCKNKIFSLITLILISVLFIGKVNALQMLSPITITDVDKLAYADIGYASPDGSFLISFLLDKAEYYNNITTDSDGEKIILIENTQNTKESVYATIKIITAEEGPKQVKLILSAENNIRKEILLNFYVTNKAIYTVMLPYDSKTKYDITKEIRFNIINKAATTKEVAIYSNLNRKWFDKDNAWRVSYTLQPGEKKEVSYKFIPKETGNKEFTIYIDPNFDKTLENQLLGLETAMATDEDNSSIIKYNLNVEVEKNLRSVYRTRMHSFPLFGLNNMPVYYFSKFVKLF